MNEFNCQISHHVHDSVSSMTTRSSTFDFKPDGASSGTTLHRKAPGALFHSRTLVAQEVLKSTLLCAKVRNEREIDF
jgi:hypothetical protein